MVHGRLLSGGDLAFHHNCDCYQHTLGRLTEGREFPTSIRPFAQQMPAAQTHHQCGPAMRPRAGTAELDTASGPLTNKCPALHEAVPWSFQEQRSALSRALPHLVPASPIAGWKQRQARRPEELCLLRACRLQCQREGAFKGHFCLGRPAHPQIQNKNRSSAPDGLVSPAPRKGLVESEGWVARGHTGQGTLASGSMRPVWCGPGLALSEMVTRHLGHHWQSRVGERPPGQHPSSLCWGHSLAGRSVPADHQGNEENVCSP